MRGTDYKNAFFQLQRLEKDFYLSSGAMSCIDNPCYSYWNGTGPKPDLEAVSNSCEPTYQSGRSSLDILLKPVNDLMQKLDNLVVRMTQLGSSYDQFIRSITKLIEAIKEFGYSEDADESLRYNLDSLRSGIETANANINCSYGTQNISYQSCTGTVLESIAALQPPCASFLSNRVTCVSFRCGTTLPDYAIVKMNLTDTFLDACSEMGPHLETMREYVNNIQDALRSEEGILKEILDSDPAHKIDATKQSINQFKSRWEALIENINS